MNINEGTTCLLQFHTVRYIRKKKFQQVRRQLTLSGKSGSDSDGYGTSKLLRKNTPV